MNIFYSSTIFLFQELRCREEELTKALLQQKIQEEFLRKREQELAEREIDLLERELNIMILQQQQGRPTPKKRKGKFKKSRLKLLKSGGQISMPCGKMHQLSCTSIIIYLLYNCKNTHLD